MNDVAQKAFWVAVPVLLGLVITFFSGERMDIQIICYAVLVLVAAFGVWTTNARAHRKEQEEKEKEWRDKLLERLDRGDRADRVLLRKELIASHREYAEEKGYISMEALKDVENTYEVYHELGGNGSGTKLWEDIKRLPVKG